MNRNTLPPLSYYPQPQDTQNNDYLNNLPTIRSQTPILDNNNNNTNSYLSSQNLIKEIRELKMSLKTQLQNQNEFQKKLIDSYKLISQQDNIIRLNTSKINEHDLKLTNILSNFNNFLKVQENTNDKLSECQDKIKNSLLPIETFISFKNQVENNNLIINENIKKIFLYDDNTDLILSDLKSTDENNLKLLLKKIKMISDKEETFFAEKHQENLNYIKEHNNIILSKINQLKEFLDGIQAQISEETNYRKINDDKIVKDITIFFNQKYEEKFKIIEKNLLETEKNLINMNKDCIKSFQELVTKQKDGNSSEFQNIKKMLEIGLKNNQVIYDKDIDEMKKLISSIKGDINETKSNLDSIEGFVKEKVNLMNDFKIKGDQSIIDFSNKIKEIEQDSLKLYEETKKNILKDLKDNIKKEKEKREEFENNINNKISSQLHSYDNNINDLKEKSNQLKKMIENKYEIENKDKNAIGINNLKLDEIYTNKFHNLNKDIQENIKNIQEDIEKKMNLMKTYIKKNMDEYSQHVDDDLYQKFNVLSNDFKEKMDKSKIELDGKIQQYFVECELRLKKQFEESINK